MNKKPLTRREKIRYKIRKKISGTAERPRLVVYRSLGNVYTQLIDDISSKTLFGVSSLEKDVLAKLADVKGKVEKSKMVGKLTAERALAKNITNVVFDRNGYLYHGRIKAVADGAREGGLKF